MKLPTIDPTAITKTKGLLRPSKTPVAAVSRKSHQHGRQADRKRQAAGQLDIATEQDDKRRDQQLAAGHAKQCSYYADRSTCCDTDDNRSRTCERRLASTMRIVTR
jgi:hypothetical protein